MFDTKIHFLCFMRNALLNDRKIKITKRIKMKTFRNFNFLNKNHIISKNNHTILNICLRSEHDFSTLIKEDVKEKHKPIHKPVMLKEVTELFQRIQPKVNSFYNIYLNI